VSLRKEEKLKQLEEEKIRLREMRFEYFEGES
jgi:ubiquitin